jgi:hypothetical protein
LNIIIIFLTIIYGIIIFTLSFIIIKSILIQIIDKTLGFDKLFINKTKSNITKILINIITGIISIGIYILLVKLNL